MKQNPNGWNYRAVMVRENRRRILGYRPSFGEAQNLALKHSMDFAHVEKRFTDPDGRPVGSTCYRWDRIED